MVSFRREGLSYIKEVAPLCILHGNGEVTRSEEHLQCHKLALVPDELLTHKNPE